MALRELVAQPQEEMLAAREICILTEPGREVWTCRCHVMLSDIRFSAPKAASLARSRSGSASTGRTARLSAVVTALAFAPDLTLISSPR